MNGGDPIIVLESMKMEIPVEAPKAGTIKEVTVKEAKPALEAYGPAGVASRVKVFPRPARRGAAWRL